jgi:hypothetical protein
LYVGRTLLSASVLLDNLTGQHRKTNRLSRRTSRSKSKAADKSVRPTRAKELLARSGGAGSEIAEHGEESGGGFLVGKCVEGDGSGEVRRFRTETYIEQAVAG